jgi:hypothetical protein
MIANRQNEPRMIRLQRARRVLLGQVKSRQGVMVFLTLLLPIASALSAAFFPNIRPAVAVFAMTLSIVDVCFFDRWVKQRLKDGAKLQEEFDCYVYQLPWNKFFAGSKLDPEDVAKHSRVASADKLEQTFRNWYSPSVDRLPLFAGRVACQRSNVRFDVSQRRSYCSLLKGAAILVILAVVLSELYFAAAFGDWVMTSLVPATPMIIWILREYNRQTDSITTVERLKTEADKLWADMLSASDGGPFEAKCRELQDAIFSHRASSPLVFDWLYSALRGSLEADMTDGMQAWVEDYEATTGAQVASK